MDVKTIRSKIESIDTIPTIPSTLQNLLKVISNPNVSLNEISDHILSDPVLTSRVLKLVNSPIYGFPGRISSLTQALILLGLNVVRGMLLGVSVFEAMEKTMLGLWKHSMGCAVAARVICNKKRLDEVEEISVAALLHDIGKVLIRLKLPEEFEKVVHETETRTGFMYKAELELLNMTHAEAGSWIAKKWSFPKNLQEAIGYHHKPHLSKGNFKGASIVHLSDMFVRILGFGYSGDKYVPPVNPQAWNEVGLTEGDVLEIFRELEESLQQAEEYFSFDA